jgi:phosphonoacetaldehyde hydrolase
MVKIGDTIPDIEEGLNAGMWTIALTVSGNGFGMTAEEVANLSPQTLEAKRSGIAAQMYQAGAHYVIDGVWDCMPVIQAINSRLAQGERP